jgi:hypothetical protein
MVYQGAGVKSKETPKIGVSSCRVPNTYKELVER